MPRLVPVDVSSMFGTATLVLVEGKLEVHYGPLPGPGRDDDLASTRQRRGNPWALAQLSGRGGLEASMTRLPQRAHGAEATYLLHSPAPAERDILEAEKRVREQEAHVLRLIVQGAPTQSTEDLLRHLTAAAEALKSQRRPLPK